MFRAINVTYDSYLMPVMIKDQAPTSRPWREREADD